MDLYYVLMTINLQTFFTPEQSRFG